MNKIKISLSERVSKDIYEHLKKYIGDPNTEMTRHQIERDVQRYSRSDDFGFFACHACGLFDDDVEYIHSDEECMVNQVLAE